MSHNAQAVIGFIVIAVIVMVSGLIGLFCGSIIGMSVAAVFFIAGASLPYWVVYATICVGFAAGVLGGAAVVSMIADA